MKKLIALCIFLFLLFNHLLAQQTSLSGKVLNDSTNQPVAFAFVQVKGGANIVADAKGSFVIPVIKQPAVILITATGFDSAVVNVAAVTKQSIVIRLVPKPLLLQDVVVSTGYQLIPKERATGSFENIDNKLLNRAVSTNVLDRLEGITSGLYFSHNRGGGREIFIRGLSTLNASTEPLIVVDNFPYEGTLENINPNNIENISILRDAAASSIWGAKAANGVIVITTKKGKYNQSKSIFVNSVVTITGKPRLMEARNYMSSADFIGVEKYLFSQGYYDGDLTNNYEYPVISPVVELLSKQRNGLISQSEVDKAVDEFSRTDIRNDYLKYLYRPAVTQQYNAGISGGGNGMNYLVSFGYDRKITSIIGNEGYRANVNTQLNIKLLPKLELQTGIIYTLAADKYNGLESVSAGGYKSSIYPYAKLADEQGTPLAIVKDYRSPYTDTAGTGYLLDWKYRPLDEVKNSDNNIGRNDLLLKLGMKYDVSKSLNIELKGQLEKTAEISDYYYGLATYYTRNFINRFSQRTGDVIQHNIPVGGILDKSYRNLLSAGVRGQINYSTLFGKWYQLTAIAGMEIRKVNATSHNTNTYGYDNEVLSYANVDYNTYYTLWDNLGGGSIQNNNGFGSTENRYVSYFSNAALTMRNQYTLSASLRKDASNLFGVNTNQKWNPFWSTGIAWKLSSASFYHLSWLPTLKARFTHGYSGNIIPGVSGKALIYYSQNDAIPLPYASVQTPANPNLRWEQTGTMNAGIDFALKEDRLTGSIDFYNKKSKDLFGYVPLDPTTGQSLLMLNAANLTSKGFNIKLNGIIINRVVKWETQLLVDHVKTRVTKYLNEYEYKSGYVGYGSYITPIAGQDPYALISFKWAGLDPLTGDPQGYVNGQVSKDYLSMILTKNFVDLSVKGSNRPTLYGSVRNTFSNKGFSLSANISYAFGYYFRRSSVNYGALFEGWIMNKDFAERWQQPGDELKTSVPSMVYPSNYLRDRFYTYSEATVEKGDHIRLRDIHVSYHFMNMKSPFLKNSEIYCYINNVGILWWANKRGIDPDFGDNIPSPVSVSFGFRTNF